MTDAVSPSEGSPHIPSHLDMRKNESEEERINAWKKTAYLLL